MRSDHVRYEMISQPSSLPTHYPGPSVPFPTGCVMRTLQRSLLGKSRGFKKPWLTQNPCHRSVAGRAPVPGGRLPHRAREDQLPRTPGAPDPGEEDLPGIPGDPACKRAWLPAPPHPPPVLHTATSFAKERGESWTLHPN